MKVPCKEIATAVVANDKAKVISIMEEFDLRPQPRRHLITTTQRSVGVEILSTAAMVAMRGELSDELAEEVLEHIAQHVSIWRLLRQLVIVDSTPLEPDANLLPGVVRSALAKKRYIDRVGTIIEEMDMRAFNALVSLFVTGDVTRVHYLMAAPILRRLYRSYPQSMRALFLLSTAVCLAQSEEECVQQMFDELFEKILDEEGDTTDITDGDSTQTGIAATDNDGHGADPRLGQYQPCL